MRSKRFFILLVSISLVLSAFKPKASAINNNSNSNRKKPKDHKRQVFKITEEDFLIEPEGTDVKALFRVYHFDFDPDGNIFIFDAGNYRVLKFDSDGNFICSFGRKGQGPGEFQSDGDMAIDNQGKVYITKDNNLSIFDNDGKYINQISVLPNYLQRPMSLVFNGQGQFVYYIMDFTEKELKDPQDAWTKYYITSFYLDTKKEIMVSEIYKHRYDELRVFITDPVVNSQRKIFHALKDSQKYKIFMYSPDGDLLKTITKKYKPIAVSKEELAEWKKRREAFSKTWKGKLIGQKFSKPFSKFYSSINELFIDSDDYLWVFTNEGRKDQLFSFDLYNPDGEYLKTFFLENQLLFKHRKPNFKVMKINGKYLYALINHPEAGDMFLRFKLPKEIWE